MFKYLYIAALLSFFQICFFGDHVCLEGKTSGTVYHVAKTGDFEITGNGSSENWQGAQWLNLTQRRSASTDDSFTTKLKALYSQTGIYFLFHCEDSMLTATMNADFLDLWKEDVVEVFLWPDESVPAYFEYELSPLNYELVLLISNSDGELHRWQPFYYETDRQTNHATAVEGGEKKSHAPISNWTAEFFIPFKLLRPLTNISPQKGTMWRANFYRVDYDDKNASWSWQLTERSFHDYKNFGTLIFD